MTRIFVKPESVKIILVITVSFLIVYYITKWQWTINFAIIVGIAGLLSNSIANGIAFIWVKTTRFLSLIVTTILLSITYYFILTPLAWLSRIFGPKDQLKLKNTDQSLFKEKNKDFNIKSFENPW